MGELLLVGEDFPFLRVLSFELGRRGITAREVVERDLLISRLSNTNPEIVVFDHVEPLDLYLLNPRTHGYAGTLLLLTHDPDSPFAAEQLGATHVLARTVLISSICEQIADLLATLRTPS